MSGKNLAPETGQEKTLHNVYNGKKIIVHIPIGDKTLEVHLTMKQALKLADDIYKQMGMII